MISVSITRWSADWRCRCVASLGSQGRGLRSGDADDSAAERLVRELQARGWGIVETLEQDTVGRLATARLSDGSSMGPVVDLLFASSRIEGGVVARAELVEVLPDVTVRVATTADLVVLKLLAVADDRPPDEQDLRTLMPLMSDDEVDAARVAARQGRRVGSLVVAISSLTSRPDVAGTGAGERRLASTRRVGTAVPVRAHSTLLTLVAARHVRQIRRGSSETVFLKIVVSAVRPRP